MKKLLSIVLVLMLLSLSAVSLAETVDAYTSASLTKSYVEGDAAAALAQILENSGSDIATAAQAAAPDYVREYGKHVLIMSVNPDGCPGMSTIGYWRYCNNRAGGRAVTITAGDWQFNSRGEGADQLVAQLTEGQNALNLYNAGIGAGSTVVISLDDGVYMIHLRVADIFVQKFDAAAYEAGEFAKGYSGADRQASSFYFVFDVLSIEKSNQIML
ncbi:MAG: hypothetical protein MJ136_02425 [Clostridia bacterium]|nr:hypothetical protein [Clostridia bacterium]